MADIPDDAIEAAARWLSDRFDLGTHWHDHVSEARDLLAYVDPALRRHIADEEIRPYIAPNPRTDHAKGWNDALGHVAARVVRGDDNA